MDDVDKIIEEYRANEKTKRRLLWGMFYVYLVISLAVDAWIIWSQING